MRYPLFILTMLLILLACTRRPQEFISYSVINNSGKEIKLYFETSTDLYARFEPDGLQKSLASRIFGITSFSQLSDKKPNFGMPAPVKVVFNDIDTVYHYDDSLVHTGKYLNLLSDRCLYNLKTYTIKKFKKAEVAIYTFTPADYEFAKQ